MDDINNDIINSSKLYKNICKRNKAKELQKIKTYNTVLSKCERKINIPFGNSFSKL